MQPSNSSEVIRTLSTGAEIHVAEPLSIDGQQWAEVTDEDGTKGYVTSDKGICFYTRAWITGEPVFVRAMSDPFGKPIGTLRRGDEFFLGGEWQGDYLTIRDTKEQLGVIDFRSQYKVADDRISQFSPPGSDAPAATTRWEVRSGDGTVRSYDEKNSIVRAIMAGEIKPDWDCRQVKVAPASGKTVQPKWRTVERSFDIYRPVSQLMWRGGAIGLSIGIMVGFALKILDATAAALTTRRPSLSGLALMSTFLFLSVLGPLVGVISPASKDIVTNVAGKLVRLLFVIGIFLFLTQGVGVVAGILLGFAGLGGLLIIGGLFGGLPGLAIGTCVGLARLRSFQLPPGASPQSSGRIVLLGIVLPLVCFSLGLFLFFQYALPFTINASIELLNTPMFR